MNEGKFEKRKIVTDDDIELAIERAKKVKMGEMTYNALISVSNQKNIPLLRLFKHNKIGSPDYNMAIVVKSEALKLVEDKILTGNNDKKKIKLEKINEILDKNEEEISRIEEERIDNLFDYSEKEEELINLSYMIDVEKNSFLWSQ